MVDGYYLNTIIDVTTTLLDFASDAINDLSERVSEKYSPRSAEFGEQPREEEKADWREQC